MLLSFLQHYWTALLLNACPTTYSKLPYRKTIARNHLSSSFCQQALPVFSSCANTSFLYLSSCANTIQTSLVKFHWLWETVEEIINKKKYSVTFWRDSFIFKTIPGPRFSSVLSFLPMYKSNWLRYPLSLAQLYQNVTPIGLFLAYWCLINLWISPYAHPCFENHHLKQNYLKFWL